MDTQWICMSVVVYVDGGGAAKHGALIVVFQ